MGNIVRGGLALAIALGAAGCHRADSVLLVEVAGDETWPVMQLSATVVIGQTTKPYMIPNIPTAIQLPTSFTIELDRDVTGPVGVSVEALDALGMSLGTGQTLQEHINVGDDTIITVTLAAPAPSGGGGGDDGGFDGGANAEAGTP